MRDSKAQRAHRFYQTMEKYGVDIETANRLRRIASAFSRWDELECGTGDGQVQKSIERDEDDNNKPYFRVQYPLPGGGYHDSRTPIADREAQAEKRLAKIMADLPELVAYHQSDPRGPSLYLVRKSDLNNGSRLEEVYTRGVAVSID